MTGKRFGLAICVILAPSPGAAQTLSFPSGITANDVKLVYGAKGDGVTDDSAAVQAALIGDRTSQSQPDYYSPRPRLVYFPPGTYLVQDTIAWLGCSLMVQGAGQGATTIKLKDGAPGFGDKTHRKPVLQTEAGNYSFRNHIRDITIDTGKGNPGAVGLDWISNNVGALRNITIRSSDGQGATGLDMTRAWPGPGLVRDLTIEGFDYGIDVSHAEYGPTFESLTLRGQNVAGIHNTDNILAVRKLTSDNAVTAIEATGIGSMLLLLDSQLGGGVAGTYAISSKGQVYLRNVHVSGYKALFAGHAGDVTSLPAGEYLNGAIRQLFPSPQRSLGLPVEEVPSFHDNDLANWAKVDCGYQGCESKLQPALDSGKATVWFPSGVHLIGGQAYHVPATVRRVLGFGSNINDYDQYGLTFIVDADAPEPVLFEQFSNQLKIRHVSTRTVVVKSCDLQYTAAAGVGKLLLDDVGMDTLVPAAGQSVWARQLNIEGSQLHVDNAGARLWILGLKSEGKGTIARTTAGGFTELLGTLLYPCQSFSTGDPTAFINVESSHSLIFGMSSYVASGFYPTVVTETRGGIEKTLPVAQMVGRAMPLFVGYQSAPPGGGGAGNSGTPGTGGASGATGGAAGSGAGGAASGGSGCSCRAGGRHDAVLFLLLLAVLELRRLLSHPSAGTQKPRNVRGGCATHHHHANLGLDLTMRAAAHRLRGQWIFRRH